MSIDRINYLNIGLMVLSLIAAFILPFEVFLLSYAILGPLHYLTEISWLHDRQYFAPRKLDWIPIAALGILLLLGAKSVMGESYVKFMKSVHLGPVVDFLANYVYDITFVTFGLALIFVVFKDWTYRGVAIVVLILAAVLFMVPDPPVPLENTPIKAQKYVQSYNEKWSHPVFKIFGIYLPTLIHVYIFTGAFILFGALKGRSKSGYASFGAFLLCAIACFALLPDMTGIAPSKWAVDNLGQTFSQLNLNLVQDFGGAGYKDIVMKHTFGGEELRASTNNIVFFQSIGVVFARFIAFAYTYHYLNWFSKTSVIRWHQVPKIRFAVVIAAWVASVGLYFYDYNVGFRWLFLLSFLHVMLEFPLNHQSFIGIGRELKMIFAGSGKAVNEKR